MLLRRDVYCACCEQPGATRVIMVSSGQCKLTASIVIYVPLFTWDVSVRTEALDDN